MDIPASPITSNIPAPPKRASVLWRIFRTGLVLAVIILLIAVGLAMFTADGHDAWVWLTEQARSESLNQAEQAAIKDLESHGALVIREPPERHATSINFCGKPVDKECMRNIGALYRLQALIVMNAEVTDDQLHYLIPLQHLTSITLTGAPITDDGVRQLSKCRDVNAMYLSASKVTDAGLPALANLPSLHILDLSQTAVTDDGLAHLVHLKALTWLVLRDTQITDAGLKHLHGMPQLRRLSLEKSKATRRGVEELKAANPNLDVDL